MILSEATQMLSDNAHSVTSRSPAFLRALDKMVRVARTDATVLITGETGTGKEFMARMLHLRSRRYARPLVAVSISAIPDALVCAELFGHEQGAFTGAVQRRLGRFEVADRSTLFLDEVGELSNAAQVALLRVIQEGEFERLGGSQTRRVDVRLIAATNRNLEEDVTAGRFRTDLYYRLSVFCIHLPPLRERREDIALLAETFLHQVGIRFRRRFEGIDSASLDRLCAFNWPGNIRQLQNVIEHSAILCDRPMLRVEEHLLSGRPAGRRNVLQLVETISSDEKLMIEQALQAAEGRVSGPLGAAVQLGVPASTLESKIRRFGIDKTRFRAG
jgi:transcriptional regulator with GAF, ATPase, and Fis domain